MTTTDKRIDFKNVIERIRIILRSNGVTGIDSINQCILFILIRYINQDVCVKLKIHDMYTYDNLIRDNNGDVDSQTLYKRLFVKYNDKTPLLKVITNRIKYCNIDFSIKHNIHIIRDILLYLKNVDLQYLNDRYDIIGTIYELHLKTGSTNSMRDLGQYFTHRKVIEYMIELCDPKYDETIGRIESILDPTMGTGGFLSMAIKYLNRNNSNIDCKKNKVHIHGCDIDKNVCNMSLLNCFLETGENFTNTLVQRDTLRNDVLIQNKPLEVDIILANEPMGIKNIKYDSCCERIRNLKIKGSKAEPLFMQLIMQSLKKGGRCAVVVPDGVLFNDMVFFRKTRKYLLENYNLKKVIKLDGDYFLNTGVKTSIMYFENNGKTKEVEFCKICMVNNDIEETRFVNVSIDKIIGTKYSLHYNKYIEKKTIKYEAFDYDTLSNICEFMKKSKRKASYGKDDGKYRFYTSSPIVKRCDEADYNEECVIIGTGGNANIKYDTQFSCSADNVIIKGSDKFKIKFLYYYLLTHMSILEDGFKGATIKHISKTYIQNIEVPIPSIEIQNIIIEKIDTIVNCNVSTKDTIYLMQKAMLNYVDASIRNVTKVNMGELCKTNSGKYIKKADMIEGDYPVYGGGDVSKYINQYNRENRMVIAKDGVSLNCVRFVKGKFFLNHHGWTLDIICDNVSEKFLYYVLASKQHELYDLAKGAAQKGINRETFYSYSIGVPKATKQKAIVKHCDNIMETIENMYNIIDKNIETMKLIMDAHLDTCSGNTEKSAVKSTKKNTKITRKNGKKNGKNTKTTKAKKTKSK